jgi:hypothetical protein
VEYTFDVIRGGAHQKVTVVFVVFDSVLSTIRIRLGGLTEVNLDTAGVPQSGSLTPIGGSRYGSSWQ